MCTIGGRARESHSTCVTSCCPPEYNVDTNIEDASMFSRRSLFVVIVVAKSRSNRPSLRKIVRIEWQCVRLPLSLDDTSRQPLMTLVDLSSGGNKGFG